MRALKWIGFVVLAVYVLLVIYRAFYLHGEDKTNAQVAKIHATKLSLNDVLGKNLPPDPGLAADETVQGVDANENGIRDDVELAIFKEYPDSAKTRAVLLQYALALQMEVTQPIVNEKTVGAIEEQKSRGYLCVGKIISRDNLNSYIKITDNLRSFVETSQLNTESRRKAQEKFYENLKSGDVPNQNLCDIDAVTLVN